MNLNEIKLELRKYGNGVINISNIGHGTTKNPLIITYFLSIWNKNLTIKLYTTSTD